MAKTAKSTRNGVRRSDRETHWRGVVSSWEKSGLTQPEFCRQNGHSYSAFRFWRKEIPKRDRTRKRSVPPRKKRPVARQKEPVSGFTTVRLVDAKDEWVMEITLAGGETVRLRRGTDPAWARSVISLLRESPPVRVFGGMR
jgi:hypothetical protein